MHALGAATPGTIAHEWAGIQGAVEALPPLTAAIAQAIFLEGAASVVAARDLDRRGSGGFFLSGILAAANVLVEQIAVGDSGDARFRARLAVLRDEIRPFAPVPMPVGRRSGRELADALQPVLRVGSATLEVRSVGKRGDHTVRLARAEIETLRVMLTAVGGDL